MVVVRTKLTGINRIVKYKGSCGNLIMHKKSEVLGNSSNLKSS